MGEHSGPEFGIMLEDALEGLGQVCVDQITGTFGAGMHDAMKRPEDRLERGGHVENDAFCTVSQVRELAYLETGLLSVLEAIERDADQLRL
mgnify:CR=1 FL=1